MANEGQFVDTGSMFTLVGQINENTDFAPLLNSSERPVAISLETVTGMSSLGLRKFVQFVEAVGKTNIKLHDCQTDFIKMANAIPNLLGNPPHPEMIASLFVPHTCSKCDLELDVFIEWEEIKFAADDVTLPRKVCQCPRRGVLNPAIDPFDFFLFALD